MKLYWNTKRMGIMTGRGIRVEGDMLTFRQDKCTYWRVFGVSFGLVFIGCIKRV